MWWWCQNMVIYERTFFFFICVLLLLTGKTHERQALIDSILSSNPDLADRETRGIVKSNRRDCFDKEWIRLLGERPLYVFDYKPNVLYTAIDPSGISTKLSLLVTRLI